MEEPTTLRWDGCVPQKKSRIATYPGSFGKTDLFESSNEVP
jgi:hypothetical protein